MDVYMYHLDKGLYFIHEQAEGCEMMELPEALRVKHHASVEVFSSRGATLRTGSERGECEGASRWMSNAAAVASEVLKRSNRVNLRGFDLNAALLRGLQAQKEQDARLHELDFPSSESVVAAMSCARSRGYCRSSGAQGEGSSQ